MSAEVLQRASPYPGAGRVARAFGKPAHTFRSAYGHSSAFLSLCLGGAGSVRWLRPRQGADTMQRYGLPERLRHFFVVAASAASARHREAVIFLGEEVNTAVQPLDPIEQRADRKDTYSVASAPPSCA